MKVLSPLSRIAATTAGTAFATTHDTTDISRAGKREPYAPARLRCRVSVEFSGLWVRIDRLSGLPEDYETSWKLESQHAVGLTLLCASVKAGAAQGIRRLLETQAELEVVATCGDLESLLSAVDAEAPDVVLTDMAGDDTTDRRLPSAPSRSRMFVSPPPWAAPSNPAPSSATSNSSPSRSSHTRIFAHAPAPACLPTFCSASRQEK